MNISMIRLLHLQKDISISQDLEVIERITIKGIIDIPGE